MVHPDYLVDVLSDEQIAGWRQYYLLKPFGHWIDSMMLAQLGASWMSNVSAEQLLPRVELIGEIDEEEQMIQSPGFGGAEEFLRNLKDGK